MNQYQFQEKLQLIYPNTQLNIIEWNGYTQSIKYCCDKCNTIHEVSDARRLLNTTTYCLLQKNINTEWDETAYSKRLNLLHKQTIKILQYHGLSASIKYICPQCGQEKSCSSARVLLTRNSLCDKCNGKEKDIIKHKIDQCFAESTDFQLITWRGVRNKLTEKCLRCGYIFDRYPINVLHCFDSCPQCNSGGTKQLLSLDTVQQRVNEVFGVNQYQILNYKGQLQQNNIIKCLTCGFIFKTRFTAFINESRGCPKCKRNKSRGEQMVQHYLDKWQIHYETQKRFIDCNHNLSSFDFCAYDSAGNMYLIEVNGRQHYKPTTKFEDLSIIQARDKIKINYCQNNNIPLIIIPYTKLTEVDIDNYLSFLKGSTTISKESRE